MSCPGWTSPACSERRCAKPGRRQRLQTLGPWRGSPARRRLRPRTEQTARTVAPATRCNDVARSRVAGRGSTSLAPCTLRRQGGECGSGQIKPRGSRRPQPDATSRGSASLLESLASKIGEPQASAAGLARAQLSRLCWKPKVSPRGLPHSLSMGRGCRAIIRLQQ